MARGNILENQFMNIDDLLQRPNFKELYSNPDFNKLRSHSKNDMMGLLKKPEFKVLTSYLDSEMSRYCSKKTIESLLDIFNTQDRARAWFYTQLHSLNYKRPYDLCKIGKQEQVYTVLKQIEFGITS